MRGFCMLERNLWDAKCNVCGAPIRAHEGVIEARGPGRGYRILCAEHMPEHALDAPAPPEASRLPSIHLDRFDGPT